jgi:hypothetical protein
MPCYGNVIYGPTADAVTPDPETNAIIPTTGKPSLTVRTIYAEDNVQVKYYEYVLTIDAIIYLGAAAPIATGTGDMEYEVARLRRILSTPGLQLKMSPVGLGTIPVINGTLGIANTNYTPDLTGGPFPSLIMRFILNGQLPLE